MTLSNALDTRFRSALLRLAEQNRIVTWDAPIDPHLEVASAMKANDGDRAILFPRVTGHDIPDHHQHRFTRIDTGCVDPEVRR